MLPIFLLGSAPGRHSRTCALACALGLGVAVASCGSSGGFGGGTGTPVVQLPMTADEAGTKLRALVKSNLNDADTTLQFLDGAAWERDFLGKPGQAECDPLDVDCVDGQNNGDIEVDLGKFVDDADEFLTEQLLVPAQLESGSETEVVYRLHPQTFCKSQSTSNDCVKFLTAVPVRVHLTSPAVGSLNVSIRYGEGKAQAATIALSDGHVDATLLLDAASSGSCGGAALGCLGSAVKSAVSIFGGSDDAAKFELTQASGQVKLSFSKISPTQASALVQVTQALSAGFKYDGEAYAASLAPSTVSAAVNSGAKSIDVSVQVGAAEASVPYRVLAEPYAPCVQMGEWDECVQRKKLSLGGSIIAKVAGFSATSTIVRGQQQASIANLGFGGGPTTISLDNKLLVSADWNTKGGGVVTTTLGYLTEKDFGVAVLSGLSVQGELALMALAADVEWDEWLRDESLSGTFDGDAKPAVRFRSNTMQVLSGKMSITSDADGAVWNATASTCWDVGTKGADGKGVVGLLGAANCPSK